MQADNQCRNSPTSPPTSRALDPRILGQTARARPPRLGPFLLRTVDPPLTPFEGRTVRRASAASASASPSAVEDDLWLVLHLMIAGRLHWQPPRAKLGGRNNLAAFDFPSGSLILTEAGSKRRASLYVCAAKRTCAPSIPAVSKSSPPISKASAPRSPQKNRTLKRALTDPRLLSGIGNAYSDEILHAAQLSPITLTHKLKPEEWQRLYDCTRNPP